MTNTDARELEVAIRDWLQQQIAATRLNHLGLDSPVLVAFMAACSRLAERSPQFAVGQFTLYPKKQLLGVMWTPGGKNPKTRYLGLISRDGTLEIQTNVRSDGGGIMMGATRYSATSKGQLLWLENGLWIPTTHDDASRHIENRLVHLARDYGWSIASAA